MPRGPPSSLVEAVGPDDKVARLIRDRDGIYGAAFGARVEKPGYRTGAHRAEGAMAKRVRGTVRRYPAARATRSRGRARRASPSPFSSPARPLLQRGSSAHEPGRRRAARALEAREAGKVVSLPRVSGLHHRYIRKRRDWLRRRVGRVSRRHRMAKVASTAFTRPHVALRAAVRCSVWMFEAGRPEQLATTSKPSRTRLLMVAVITTFLSPIKSYTFTPTPTFLSPI